MNIVLYGMKSCGKSTIGKGLAKAQGDAFIDTDCLIEEVYKIQRKKNNQKPT